MRRLSFLGKSGRDNASWTESAFRMSSKLGNAPLAVKVHIESGCIFNASKRVAPRVNLFTRPENSQEFSGLFILLKFLFYIGGKRCTGVIFVTT